MLSSFLSQNLGRQARPDANLFGEINEDENAPVFDLGRFLDDHRSRRGDLRGLDVAWFLDPKSLAVMDWFSSESCTTTFHLSGSGPGSSRAKSSG